MAHYFPYSNVGAWSAVSSFAKADLLHGLWSIGSGHPLAHVRQRYTLQMRSLKCSWLCDILPVVSTTMDMISPTPWSHLRSIMTTQPTFVGNITWLQSRFGTWKWVRTQSGNESKTFHYMFSTSRARSIPRISSSKRCMRVLMFDAYKIPSCVDFQVSFSSHI